MLFISNERETETLMPHPHHHNMFDQTSVCFISQEPLAGHSGGQEFGRGFFCSISYTGRWGGGGIASQAGVFRGARFSSLPTNARSAGNNIPFPLFYLRGK